MRGCEAGEQIAILDRPAIQARLDKHTRRTETCWLWTASVNRKGYGQFMMRNGDGRWRCHLAHRVALAASGVTVAAGALVIHSCDTPACVNPAHLSLGTLQDNVDDCVSKNRHKWPTPRFGASNHKSKLTRELADAVRVYLGAGESKIGCSRIFGVSRSVVQNISKGVTWR